MPVRSLLRPSRGLFLVVAVLFSFLAADFTSPKESVAEEISFTKEADPPVLSKKLPESIQDLMDLQQRVAKLSEPLMRCTVGVQIGRGQGSGVIVSEDGYVLTAAHVIGRPGRNVTLILHDGKRIRGKTLGVNSRIDAGLIKINGDGPWPFARMGDVKDFKIGDWVLALGHPRGYQKDRPPVVRFGRLILKRRTVLQSGCTLVGGDSGGPLFDLKGRVIGIHSRIGATSAWNFHVPISAYIDDWERLKSATADDVEENTAIIGVRGEDHPKGCRITGLSPDLPAANAGLKVGDIITKFGGQDVKGFESLYQNVGKRKPKQKVKVEYLRGETTFEVELELVARPS